MQKIEELKENLESELVLDIQKQEELKEICIKDYTKFLNEVTFKNFSFYKNTDETINFHFQAYEFQEYGRNSQYSPAQVKTVFGSIDFKTKEVLWRKEMKFVGKISLIEKDWFLLFLEKYPTGKICQVNVFYKYDIILDKEVSNSSEVDINILNGKVVKSFSYDKETKEKTIYHYFGKVIGYKISHLGVYLLSAESENKNFNLESFKKEYSPVLKQVAFSENEFSEKLNKFISLF